MSDERTGKSNIFIEFFPRSPEFAGAVPVSPSTRERGWFHPGFYHCLPLQLANQLGWTVPAPDDFSVFWTGHEGAESLTVHGPASAIVSHFGHGIFTFRPPYLFRTSSGVDLLAKAVPNLPKDGVCVLEGLIETDNFRGHFTFNFKVTRPDCWIAYTKGEPLAQIVPYPRGWLDKFDARSITEGPDYQAVMEATETFSRVRTKALASSQNPLEQRDWHYFKGRHLDETPYAEHTKKLRVPPFPAVSRSHEESSQREKLPAERPAELLNKAASNKSGFRSADLDRARPRYQLVQDFFPDVAAMRAAYLAHWANPNEHHSQTHQIWNYWYAPPLYTYLRTTPEKVFPKQMVETFLQHLTRWSIKTLGLSNVTRPYLGLYLNGCRQGFHNDSNNGRFAYVFSLTDWTNRQFNGGETMLFPEEPYWTSNRRRKASAGSGLYDVVPPLFNQLLVFDDQLIHGVDTVIGTSDPTKGRVVLTGHLREGGIVIDGPLDQQAIAQQIGTIRPRLDSFIREQLGELRGLLTLRLDVSEAGEVSHIESLLHNVESAKHEPIDPVSLFGLVNDSLTTMRFPSASASTSLYVPLRFQTIPPGWATVLDS